MKSYEIKNFRDAVSNTHTFKSWPKVVQKISLTRNCLKSIKDGLTIAENIGYKKWEKQSNSNWRNKELVNELINTKCTKAKILK
jgi:hypothetical protein